MCICLFIFFFIHERVVIRLKMQLTEKKLMQLSFQLEYPDLLRKHVFRR